ncbi:hypothetical protein H2201_001213 [Coniosporium apollinis]|uniref:FAM192A/Fyv6 N-terminal domain-containing protein n=2 Tax=Coniosporium TaxID=2810619 RepID=A0ABQ9P5G1_9PEZI|nr:hypothetical protein H2199_001625 [Cladosporium sp. JES 115]KAJ9668571.1 hypothetical protein H2201_001213 [Coniosporium apollinis]
MSRFVPGGTIDQPNERDDAWLKAQQEIEAAQLRKAEEKKGFQEGGKTLYETLQANKGKAWMGTSDDVGWLHVKAAKQEAFEESIRLKNQFRSLDDDEVEFLDSVLESTRAKEAAVRKETSEQLELFRRQQEEAEKAALREGDSGSPLVEEEQWHTSGRKRKKPLDKGPLKGVKLRKSSSTAEKPEMATSSTAVSAAGSSERKTAQNGSEAASPSAVIAETSVTSAVTSATPAKNADIATKTSLKAPSAKGPAVLGLGGYSSDEDD